MKAKMMLAAVVLLIGAPSAQAQYSDLYYHRVGDTIEWRSEIGYYAWWEFESYFDNNRMLFVQGIEKERLGPRDYYYSTLPDSMVLLARYYTPTPLRIVGVAGSCYRGDWPSPAYMLDTDYHKEYFLVYEAMPDSFPKMAQLEWNPFDPHRTLHLKTHASNAGDADDSCCHYAPHDYYIPIYEYYLDSAITVNDSFYVGGTYFGDSVWQWLAPMTGYHTASISSGAPCAEYHSEGLCYFPPQPYKSKAGLRYQVGQALTPSFSNAQWKWFNETWHLPLIYPLIEVDTTVPPATACVPVANVQATVEGTTATVTWDGFPNYTSLRLRYGFAAHPQSVWTEVTLPEGTTMYTLSGLLPTMPYGVTLQAECEKKETEWSAPVTFYTGQDTSSGGQGTEGVEETMLSRLTFLAPNPARDEVTVTSSFSLSRIEIHDLQGVMVFSEPVSGHDVTLPLDFLRSGTYIVSIHTHNGTTHKRLAVAR